MVKMEKSDRDREPPPDNKAPPVGAKGDKKVELTVVVNGQPVEIKTKLDEPLATVRDMALKKTDNVGQPPENWELKNEGGTVLELAKLVGAFGFEPGTTLFLSLKAGVAGA